MVAHRFPPPTYVFFDASLVDSPAGHPSAPPLPSHPSTVDALVCNPSPPPFQLDPSTKVTKIKVS
jgi:hypothetical protein